jgi:hypothetical protein
MIDAAGLVVHALRETPAVHRPRVLRDILANAGAALASLEGPRAACESLDLLTQIIAESPRLAAEVHHGASVSVATGTRSVAFDSTALTDVNRMRTSGTENTTRGP